MQLTSGGYPGGGVTLPPGSVRENPEACPSGIRHGGGAKLNLALGRNSLAQAMPQTPGGTAISVRHAYAGREKPRKRRAYSHQANERPRCRRRAASLTSFHSLRVGNAGGRLVWNVRTYTAMRREKAQVAQTARPKVPMRRRGADCSVLVMKRGNARGAKGAGYRH